MTVSLDSTLCAIDMVKGAVRQRYEFHSKPVHAFAWMSGASRSASASPSEQLLLFLPVAYARGVSSVWYRGIRCWLPGGVAGAKVAASAGVEHAIALWTPYSNMSIGRLVGHDTPIKALRSDGSDHHVISLGTTQMSNLERAAFGVVYSRSLAPSPCWCLPPPPSLLVTLSHSLSPCLCALNCHTACNCFIVRLRVPRSVLQVRITWSRYGFAHTVTCVSCSFTSMLSSRCRRGIGKALRCIGWSPLCQYFRASPGGCAGVGHSQLPVPANHDGRHAWRVHGA